jgi:hypothetical protein
MNETSIWSYWKERLPDYLSKKEYIELGFLSETVEVERDGYGGTDKIFYFENGAFHACLRHWDAGNSSANCSYNRTALCKQDFIKILEDKKAIILCKLPNTEKAKFESVFEDVKEILLSFA